MFHRVNILLRDLLSGNPALQSFAWKLRTEIWKLQNLRYPKRPFIDFGPELAEALSSRRPLAAGKIGKVELAALDHFLLRMRNVAKHKASRPYPRSISDSLFLNAGVFPQQEDIFDRFGCIYRDAVKEMDVLMSWGLQGETQIFHVLAPGAKLAPFASVEPYLSDEPWSALLEDKRVLVVSPFAETIARQYFGRRTDIWKNQRVLPAFTLLAIRCPLSAGVVKPAHSDWIEALDDLRAQMSAVDFDVALIGAGAFSLPLATHARSLGKIGVHMGGTTQILFGVYGNRWADKHNYPNYQTIFNEFWVRPNRSETPAEAVKIENACYW